MGCLTKINKMTELDVFNQDEFIDVINKIKIENKSGKIKIINLNLKNLSLIIKGHLDFINLDNPIVMDKSKIRKIMKPYNKEKHQHGITADNIYNAMLNINDPYMIIQTVNNPYNITFFTSITTIKGDEIFVGFDFNYKLKNQENIVSHIETIFGSNKINREAYETLNYLNGRKVVYKKRSGWFATIAPTTTSTYSMHQNNKDVK